MKLLIALMLAAMAYRYMQHKLLVFTQGYRLEWKVTGGGSFKYQYTVWYGDERIYYEDMVATSFFSRTRLLIQVLSHRRQLRLETR